MATDIRKHFGRWCISVEARAGDIDPVQRRPEVQAAVRRIWQESYKGKQPTEAVFMGKKNGDIQRVKASTEYTSADSSPLALTTRFQSPITP